MAKTKVLKIRVRQGSAPNGVTVLENGEFGYDSTNKILKLGDGVTAWKDLTAIETNRSSVRIYYDDDGYLCYESRS